MRHLTLGLYLALVASSGMCSGVLAQGDLGDLERRVDALEASETQGSSLLTRALSRFKFYGFTRIDAVSDDSETNDTQVTFFVKSEDTTPPVGTPIRKNDGSFSIYTRLTRLGWAFEGPRIDLFGGADITGKLELDFYGFANSDRSNDLRMRHAYLNLDFGDHQFLAGQTSDMISPLYPNVNADLIHWNTGNLGDRRPQLRYTFAPQVRSGKLTAQGALALQGAISGRDSDTGGPDGISDGEDGGHPQFQGRVAYSTNVVEGARDASAGLWVARGKEQIDSRVMGERNFEMDVLGVDLWVPITKDIWIQGEAWTGKNLRDLRGGVGQGINATTGAEIEAHGWWAELGVNVHQGDALHGTIYSGYSVDDPENNDVPLTTSPTTGIARNSVAWVAYVIKKYNPLSVGLEWSYWTTEFTNGFSEGNNNKARLYFMYSF